MKNKIIIPICTICILALSCSTDEDAVMTITENSERHIKLELITQDMTTIESRMSKADESTVQDLNLYAIKSGTDKIVHQYIPENGARYMILPDGTWELYAIANYGSDLGRQTVASLHEQYETITGYNHYDKLKRLPMLGKQTVTVNAQTSAITLFLQRRVVKLNVYVKLAPEVKDEISLHLSQVMNTPERLALTDMRTFDQRKDLNTITFGSIPERRIYYLYENLAGTVPSITKPEQRILGVAPAKATYIRILGTYGKPSYKNVYYHIYPGGNQTSDFNLKRNTEYQLTVTVCGSNPSDLRLSSSDIAIKDNYLECKKGETVYTEVTVNVSNNIDADRFSFSYYKIEGSPTVIVDGVENPPQKIEDNISGKDITRTYKIGVRHDKAGLVTLRFHWNNSLGNPIDQYLNVNFK